MTPTESPSRTVGRIALMILAAAVLFSIVVRWRLRDMPLERDEGGFAYIGQLLLGGVPPYQLAYDEKLPGIYLAYAGMMAVFGQTAVGIHLGLLVVNVATIVLIFFFARDLFDSLAGGIAAAAYSLLAVSPSVLGMTAHATHFVAFFSVAATWTLWHGLQREKMPLLLVSGLLFGAAFLMKQHGVFLSGFGALMVLIHYAGLRPFCGRKLLGGLFAFALGVILPYAAVCRWLLWAGVFDRFWFWTVLYSRQHVGLVSLPEGLQIFWAQATHVVSPTWPLWIAAFLGAILVGRGKDVRQARWFVYAYFVFSFLCVCPGLFFRIHYFIVLLPPVAMLGGVAGARLLHFAAHWQMGGQPDRRRQPVAKAQGQRRNAGARAPVAAVSAPGILLWPAIVLLLAAGGIVVWQQREFSFVWTPTRVCREVYGANPFVESPVIAEYLNRHLQPDQQVAVLGSEPQLYFYTKRVAATKYITVHSLMEPQPFASKMQEEMRQEIEEAKPEFLIFVGVDVSWMVRPDSDRFLLDWKNSYVRRFYHPVGLADILWPKEEQTDYRWGDQALHARPRAPCYVWIYQRNE